MKRYVLRLKKELAEPIPKAGAVFLMIAGVFMGIVFTLGMGYWEGPVSREESISVSAMFSSCKEENRNGHIREIIVRFTDHEQLTINNVCLSDEVIRKIEALEPGAALNLRVHPNSSTILEMVHTEEVILGFDEAVGKLSRNVRGFTALGILMYLCAAFGAVKLMRKETY